MVESEAGRAPSNEDPPYAVAQEDDGRYRVVSDTGLTICVLADRTNAEQYAVLLTEAFRRGFKLGYRDGKRSVSK